MRSKKKIGFDKVAKFNYELDSNKEIKEAINQLSMAKNDMDRTEYISGLLTLFKKAGVDISVRELDILLLLRSKTDQMLVEEKKQTNHWNKR